MPTIHSPLTEQSEHSDLSHSVIFELAQRLDIQRPDTQSAVSGRRTMT